MVDLTLMTEFPDTHRLVTPVALADGLCEAAEQLPAYDNQEYYSTELQTSVYRQIRQRCAGEFDDFVAQIKERLARRPYCVLVEGLRFDENNRLFVAINRAFGILVARPYEKPRAQLVHYIQQTTDLPAAQHGRYESEKLHTDTADWDPPVRVISMVCARPDPRGGGRSLVIDVESIRDEVSLRLGTETLRLLQSETVPWQLAPYRGGGIVWRTILNGNSICWRRYSINRSLDAAGAELSSSMEEALDAFENVLAETSRTIEFSMRSGDLLFVDNWRTLHARTPIDQSSVSERLMIRSWISTGESE